MSADVCSSNCIEVLEQPGELVDRGWCGVDFRGQRVNETREVLDLRCGELQDVPTCHLSSQALLVAHRNYQEAFLAPLSVSQCHLHPTPRASQTHLVEPEASYFLWRRLPSHAVVLLHSVLCSLVDSA